METYPFPPSVLAFHSILLVDDDPDSAYLLKRDLLRSFPYSEIREIPSCAALQIIGLVAPDLLVSAYRLQGITGFEFIGRVREHGGRFPIAMISSMPIYQAQALQAGADLFLTYEDAKQIGCKLLAWMEHPSPPKSPELRRRID